MIPGSANALLLGSAAGGSTISRSARFNAADSAYLSRTPASAGNRKTWTWAGWVKRSKLGTTQALLAGAIAQNYLLIYFHPGDTLQIENYNNGLFVSSAVYRDVSAWMHLVISVDTTTAVSGDRIRLYANGVQQTASTYTAPTQNTDLFVNQAVEHRIGAFGYSGFNHYCDIMLTDVHFIDGQALDPTSFGEFSATTGVWMPKAYTGTYGTNGFKLDFSDNSAATATTLGKDSSGNGNNFTPNNLSITAGAGNDSLIDVPVNGTQTDTGAGGEVRGNYCTLNALKSSATLSNGNLQADAAASNWYPVVGTIHASSGKWYWEVTPTALGLSQIGVATPTASIAVDAANIDYANCYTYYNYSGNKFGPTSNNSAYGAAYSAGDVIGIALDMDAGTLVFYKNNVSQGTAYSGLTGLNLAPFVAINDYGSTGTAVFNFGQRTFAYTAPSGFKALCTANLPAPTIVKPSTVMDVVLWTGNGASPRTISGLNFSPDLVWIKNRTTSGYWNVLFDAIRGGGQLSSNQTDAELAAGSNVAGYVSAYTSNGFTLSAGSSNINTVNENGSGIVGWCWDAGSSTVTNTAGTISSQVRANASAGFSIVTYTHPYPGAYTVGHGLNTPPRLIITKGRNFAINWYTYSAELPNTHYLLLNSTGAAANYGAGLWNNTSPTSTVFSVGTDLAGYDYVAYCFAPVAGYSAFGSYTGNGSTDGPFVYTGFRPRWVMVKKTNSSSVSDWVIQDAGRDTYNASNKRLYANLSNAEDTGSNIDLLSNGFKIRVAGAVANINESTSTYIYAAFAESPFSLARAR